MCMYACKCGYTCEYVFVCMLAHLCVCVGHVHAVTHMLRSKDNLQEPIPSFSHVSPRGSK